MDLCAQVYVAVVSPRHEHSLSRKNEKMSNAEAAAAPEAESDLSVLEAINELRAEEHFIDIKVEVCDSFMY